MNKKTHFWRTWILVEVEVASTVIGNPYVDLAPPDCMGDGWSGDGLGEDVGFILRLTPPRRISLSWRIREARRCGSSENLQVFWSSEAVKEASSPLINHHFWWILPVVEILSTSYLITLQLFLQTRKIGSLYINFFNQRECFYKKHLPSIQDSKQRPNTQPFWFVSYILWWKTQVPPCDPATWVVGTSGGHTNAR